MERSSNLGHSPMITLSMRNAPTGIDLLHSDSNGRMNVFRGEGGKQRKEQSCSAQLEYSPRYSPSRQWSASPRRAPLRLRQWPPLNDLIYNVRGAVINYVLGDLLRHLGEPPPKALRS